jgi:hypothetical protein
LGNEGDDEEDRGDAKADHRPDRSVAAVHDLGGVVIPETVTTWIDLT